MRQSLCYKLVLSLKEHMMGMSKLLSWVRKFHSQDFIHSPSVIVSHCRNISKCLIFSCVIWLSLEPSQFVSSLPFISWATLPTIAILGTVQQQRLLTLPALTWSGPAPKESSRKPDQLLFQQNWNRYLRDKAVRKDFPNHAELGEILRHSNSVVLAAHIQYLSAQHTSKDVLLQRFEQWIWLTASWSVTDDDRHAKTETFYSSVSAPCFKIQQC